MGRRSGDWAGPADQPWTGELASAHARGTPLVSLVGTWKHSKKSVTRPIPGRLHTNQTPCLRHDFKWPRPLFGKSLLERCAVCGAEEFIPYICRYCGGVHCVYHRLPENHACPNIEQARAPRPILRSERRTETPTIRMVKTPVLSRVSSRELTALLTALAVLSISFSVQYLLPLQTLNIVQYLEILSLTAVIVGTGFLAHELAHKFTAEKYGCWAEFKLWTYGALMALLFAFVSGGTFVFAAPGAVYIASR